MIKRWAPAAHQPWASDAKAEVRNLPNHKVTLVFGGYRGSQHANFQSSRLPTIARVKQRPPNCWRRFAWKRWEALVIQDDVPEQFWDVLGTKVVLGTYIYIYPRRWYHLKSRYVFKKWLVLVLSTLSWGLSKSHPHRKEIFLFVSHTFIRPY